MQSAKSLRVPIFYELRDRAWNVSNTTEQSSKKMLFRDIVLTLSASFIIYFYLVTVLYTFPIKQVEKDTFYDDVLSA